MATHHLKTWPGPFQAIWDCRKYWEIRKNDRDFHVGDKLTLQEWYPDNQTWGERIIRAEVKYILDGEFGLREGYVCMSLTEVRRGYFEGDEVTAAMTDQRRPAMSLMMKYFVLKPRGQDKFAAASRRAMLAYANWIEAKAENDDERKMASEMIAWVEREWLDAHEDNFSRIYHAGAELSA